MRNRKKSDKIDKWIKELKQEDFWEQRNIQSGLKNRTEGQIERGNCLRVGSLSPLLPGDQEAVRYRLSERNQGLEIFVIQNN